MHARRHQLLAGPIYFGQNVCEPKFDVNIPPVRISIHSLKISDACFYHPEDRRERTAAGLAAQLLDPLGRR
jgi:hypothetical protein